METPDIIAGRPVVAAVALTTWTGENQPRMLVITQTSARVFNIHRVRLVAREPWGPVWESYAGTYDLTWQRALSELAARASYGPPQSTAAAEAA